MTAIAEKPDICGGSELPGEPVGYVRLRCRVCGQHFARNGGRNRLPRHRQDGQVVRKRAQTLAES